MILWRVGWHRLRGLFRRDRLESGLEAEIAFHLQAETDEGVRRGLSPEAARAEALRRFGGVARTKEAYRETNGWPAIESFLQDLRYAFRMLRRSPGFAAAAVLSLALGIGANTAIFSLLNAVVLRPLPVASPRQLVQLIYTIPKEGPDNWNSFFGYEQCDQFGSQSRTLSGVVCGTWMGRLNVVYRGSSRLAEGQAETGNFFSLLGLAPQYGRFFEPAEDRSGAAIAVVSDAFWRERFAADPAAIGAAITINQVPFTIIGVTPPDFAGITTGGGPDLWIPLHALDRFTPDRKRWTEPFTSWLTIVGRLRPGVPMARAQAELDVIHRQTLARQLAASKERQGGGIQNLVRASHLQLRPADTGTASGLRAEYALPLQLLLWVSGIVVLVACANVANLLLARASSRRREIAIRLSMGAGRGRIVRQLITESSLLAAMAGILGLVLAWWGSMALVRMISIGDSLLPLDTRPDWRVFSFTAGLSCLTGILFGLAPAVRGTHVDPGPALKQGTFAGGRRAHALDRALVVVQIALSVVLVCGAGLFVRTLHRLWKVNVGYDRANVLMFSVDAKLAGYTPEHAGAVYQEILRRLSALPQVVRAGASVVRPVDDYFDLVDRVNEIDGRALSDRETIEVAWNAVTPGYFAAVSTPLLLGRDFDMRDDAGAPQVAIVNQTLARLIAPGGSPLGRRLGDDTVVGVVQDSLYHGAHDRPGPVLYRSLLQYGKMQAFRWGFVSFELRYRSGGNLPAEVRRQVAAVDRNLPVFRTVTLEQQTSQSLLKERLLATLSSFFGGLALLLACFGLYGLMAYTVSRRTAEIGIRLALGARRGHVLWMVLRETLWLSASGIACGVPAAIWAARYARSLLFEVAPSDPWSLAAAISLLLAVALVAGYLPARRTAQVQPMTALRCD